MVQRKPYLPDFSRINTHSASAPGFNCNSRIPPLISTFPASTFCVQIPSAKSLLLKLCFTGLGLVSWRLYDQLEIPGNSAQI
jgi:hypothetical protein